MKFQIQPLTVLCDERVNLRILGLPSLGKAKISASMSFPWAKSVEHESDACSTADSGGNLDLSKERPDSGSYDSIDRMGLILSLKRVKGEFWCFQGPTPRRVSLWTYAGKSLPFVKFAWLSCIADFMCCFTKNKPVGFAYLHRKSLEAATNREEARIKLQDSQADILLFGGQKDG